MPVIFELEPGLAYLEQLLVPRPEEPRERRRFVSLLDHDDGDVVVAVRRVSGQVLAGRGHALLALVLIGKMS